MDCIFPTGVFGSTYDCTGFKPTTRLLAGRTCYHYTSTGTAPSLTLSWNTLFIFTEIFGRSVLDSIIFEQFLWIFGHVLLDTFRTVFRQIFWTFTFGFIFTTLYADDVAVRTVGHIFRTFWHIFCQKGGRKKVRNISEKICPKLDRWRKVGRIFFDEIFVGRRVVGELKDAAVEVRTFGHFRSSTDVATQKTSSIKNEESLQH